MRGADDRLEAPVVPRPRDDHGRRRQRGDGAAVAVDHARADRQAHAGDGAAVLVGHVAAKEDGLAARDRDDACKAAEPRVDDRDPRLRRRRRCDGRSGNERGGWRWRRRRLVAHRLRRRAVDRRPVAGGVLDDHLDAVAPVGERRGVERDAAARRARARSAEGEPVRVPQRPAAPAVLVHDRGGPQRAVDDGQHAVYAAAGVRGREGQVRRAGQDRLGHELALHRRDGRRAAVVEPHTSAPDAQDRRRAAAMAWARTAAHQPRDEACGRQIARSEELPAAVRGRHVEGHEPAPPVGLGAEQRVPVAATDARHLALEAPARDRGAGRRGVGPLGPLAGGERGAHEEAGPRGVPLQAGRHEPERRPPLRRPAVVPRERDVLVGARTGGRCRNGEQDDGEQQGHATKRPPAPKLAPRWSVAG